VFGRRWFAFSSVFLFCLVLPDLNAQTATGKQDDLSGLLPSLEGWSLSEPPQTYLPENLFEYIDGAAESYLSYDFQRLVVGQYKKSDASDALTVEIYDLGSPRNAFGIYGIERYPESRFLQIGAQGYLEEGSLNFFSGSFYIKLMCYDCGAQAEQVLLQAARLIAGRISNPAGFPSVLASFPEQNRVANSEKFILKNFLGMSFLEAGYTAQYRVGEVEFEAFIIEAGSADKAAVMLEQFLTKSGVAPGYDPAKQSRFTWKDRYLKNVFIDKRGAALFGLIKVPDGQEGLAKPYLDDMAGALGMSLR
jgi:hypothetical protein